MKKYSYLIDEYEIYIFQSGNKIVGVSLEDKDIIEIREETNLIKKTKRELEEYFMGRRKKFDIPIELVGSEFQKEVWTELLNIPYGETRSYGEVARKINREKAYRAVGSANNKNPLYILVPCHRVIGANGSLVGYGGGLDMKKKLLYLESQNDIYL